MYKVRLSRDKEMPIVTSGFENIEKCDPVQRHLL